MDSKEEEFSSQHISNNIDIILNKISDKNDWKRKIEDLGLTIVFYGIDLKKLTTDTLLEGSSYIAIGLTSKASPSCWPSHFTHGYPLLRLFLQCLKPWKWSREGKHTVVITDSKIELNIGDYALGCTTAATPADTQRLFKGGKFSYVESAMICGALDADGTFSCIDCDDQLLFIPKLWGQEGFRMFYPCSLDCSCGLEKKLKHVKGFDLDTEYSEVEEAYSGFNTISRSQFS
jgi:hypothetical protein